MKIYEAPNLPRGEKLPDYVEMWVKTIFAELAGLYDKQEDHFMVSEVENAHDKIWVGTKCLMYQAIESIAEKAYVLATKNIEEKDGLYVTNGNRMKLNDLKDGLQRIPADKKKERFEFLIQQIFRGAGFGHNVSLTTIIDAFNQDQSFQVEDSIVQTYLAEQDKKTGKFPNADKLIYKLIEKHRTEINLENVLTPENALVLPPVYLKDNSGKPKKYNYSVKEEVMPYRLGDVEKNLMVFKLTKPENLELETYLQDICIGDDSQGFKKSLIDGSMMFFSVGRLLPKARTLDYHLTKIGGLDSTDETTYFSQSTNPEIKKIKTRIIESFSLNDQTFGIEHNDYDLNLLREAGEFTEDFQEMTSKYQDVKNFPSEELKEKRMLRIRMGKKIKVYRRSKINNGFVELQ